MGIQILYISTQDQRTVKRTMIFAHLNLYTSSTRQASQESSIYKLLWYYIVRSDFNDKKKIYPILPYLPNAGKGDCEHYHSQLGTATGAIATCGGGTGFIQDGGVGSFQLQCLALITLAKINISPHSVPSANKTPNSVFSCFWICSVKAIYIAQCH